jgi:HSP20 family protein
VPNIIPRNRMRPGNWLQGMSNMLDRWLPDRERESGEDTALMSMFERGGPALDVVDDDDEIRVTADLPGVDKDDFQIEVVGDRLVLRGEKKAEREERKGDYYYSERSYGSFSRTIPLPAEVDPDKAEARFKNGELRIRLPKTEEAKSRRVKVRVD